MDGTSTCFFKLIYGIPCPGCGLSRSFIHLFRGDIGGAFRYHPLFPAVIAVCAIAVLRKYGPFRTIFKSQLFWIGLILLFIMQWAVRMLLLFPDTPPMDFDNNALLYRLVRYLIAAVMQIRFFQ